jgi:hypothetical protein
MAENCKIHASILTPLLGRSAAISLLYQEDPIIKKIYVKGMELLLQHSVLPPFLERDFYSKHLVSFENQKSTLMKYFIDFISGQNPSKAEEFLELFRKEMKPHDLDQAHYAICESSILLGIHENIKKAYEMWNSRTPSETTFIMHLKIAFLLLKEELDKKKNLAQINVILQSYNTCLCDFGNQILLLPKEEMELLSLQVKAIIKSVSDTQKQESGTPLAKLWDISTALKLIDDTTASMPSLLVESKLKEGRVPLQVVETIVNTNQQCSPVSAIHSKWGLQLFHNIIDDPDYRKIHADNLGRLALRLFETTAASVTIEERVGLLRTLGQKKLYPQLIYLFSTQPLLYATLIESNRSYRILWSDLIDALEHCPDLVIKYHVPLYLHMVSKVWPKSFELLSEESCLIILECAMKEFIHNPSAKLDNTILGNVPSFKNFGMFLNVILFEMPQVKNSVRIRNMIQDFISQLLKIGSLEAVLMASVAYMNYNNFATKKPNPAVKTCATIKANVSLLKCLRHFQKNHKFLSSDESYMIETGIHVISEYLHNTPNCKAPRKMDLDAYLEYLEKNCSGYAPNVFEIRLNQNVQSIMDSDVGDSLQGGCLRRISRIILPIANGFFRKKIVSTAMAALRLTSKHPIFSSAVMKRVGTAGMHFGLVNVIDTA